MSFSREFRHKARKQHVCSGCGFPIEKGDIYSGFCGVSDGEFFIEKLHKDCYEIFCELFQDFDDDEWSWNEMSEEWREYKCCKCDRKESCDEDEVEGAMDKWFWCTHFKAKEEEK
jgi:hypothetical protein